MASSTADSTPISFQQLPLSLPILNVLEEIGYEQATPVQAGSIAPALDGCDLMVQSQTGTGKTAAFTLPLIEQLQGESEISALVLTPTRELARQVATEAERLAAQVNFQVACVYGGVSFDRQVVEIKSKPTLIVGTPGRVLDHLRRRTLSFKHLRCFVLDEADEMLSMGFADELDQILKFLPQQRQTLLFSATFPSAVKRYAKKTLNDPISLSFLEEESSADHLEHYYILVRGVARSKHLARLIAQENPESALVFTNTRRDAELVTRALNRIGISAGRLSGDMDQPERDRVMKKIKSKSIKLVVATDVAARGIDISQLSHVFHYQLPSHPEVYIHRSGRTGRAGAKGVVISLAASQDLGVIHLLRRAHHIKMIERPLPPVNTPTPTVTPSVKEASAENLGAKTETNTCAEINTKRPAESDSASTRPKRATRGSSRARTSSSEEVTPRASSERRARSTPKGSSSRRVSVSARPDEKPNHKTTQDVVTRDSERTESRGEGRRARRTRRSSAQDAHRTDLRSSSQSVSQSVAEDSTLTTSQDSNPESHQDLIKRALASHEALDTKDLARHLSELTHREVDQLSSELSAASISSSAWSVILRALSSAHRNKPREERNEPPETPITRAPVKAEVTRHSSGEPSHSTWLYINLGLRDCEGDSAAVRDLIAELGGLLPEDIEHIKVKDRHSLVAIESVFSDDLIAAIHGEQYGDKTLRMEPSRSQA